MTPPETVATAIFIDWERNHYHVYRSLPISVASFVIPRVSKRQTSAVDLNEVCGSDPDRIEGDLNKASDSGPSCIEGDTRVGLNPD